MCDILIIVSISRKVGGFLLITKAEETSFFSVLSKDVSK